MGGKGVIYNTFNNKDLKKLKIKKIEGKHSRAFSCTGAFPRSNSKNRLSIIEFPFGS